MRTDLFDFDLPPERIALRPISPRDAARLLVVRPGGGLEDRGVRDLPDLLLPGDAVVVNDTRVIPARLTGRRIGRGVEPKIEVTLHRRLDGARWRAFVKPGRRLQAGDVVRVCVRDSGEGMPTPLLGICHSTRADGCPLPSFSRCTHRLVAFRPAARYSRSPRTTGVGMHCWVSPRTAQRFSPVSAS